MSKYCKWYCVEYIDKGKWLYESRCGEKREVSKGQKFFEFLRADNDRNLCPKCGKPVTVGELMD
jgi:hypothetical protein